MTPVLSARRLGLDALGVALLLFMAAPVAFAQQNPMLELRPHCDKTDQAICPSFEVEDPTAMHTPVLNAGGMLDIDVILRNPARTSVSAVRSWLSYDAEILEGVSVTLDPAFSIPIPGEAEFSPTDGFVKIGAASEDGKEPADIIIRVARVQMKVKQTPASGKSPIGFYDQKPDGQGHTAAIASSDPARQSMITDILGSLLVRIAASATSSAAQSSTQPQPAGIASSIASSSSTGTASSAIAPSQAASSQAMSSATPVAATPFNLLQVQNLRITSEKTTLYLAWDDLKTPRLQGYNVYYGTQMGRYIQRRSLPTTATSLSIRDLPLGTAYYASVRAVDDQGNESAFSQEAGVEIGNPRTSTSPLLAIPPEGGSLTGDVTAPKNPVNGGVVSGESGSSSVLLLLLGASAGIGMLVALRRQFIAVASSAQ